jgi:hypothetical protein
MAFSIITKLIQAAVDRVQAQEDARFANNILDFDRRLMYCVFASRNPL